MLFRPIYGTNCFDNGLILDFQFIFSPKTKNVVYLISCCLLSITEGNATNVILILGDYCPALDSLLSAVEGQKHKKSVRRHEEIKLHSVSKRKTK